MPPGPPIKSGGPRPAHPATGRSFVTIMILASLIAIGVTIWTLYSLAGAGRAKGGPAKFQI